MEKRLSKKQMRYLRESYQFKSDEELARDLQVDGDTVQKAMKNLGLKRTRAEQKQVARIAQ
jgi:DNA-binding CsgD family transcriptional regulator